MACGSSLSRREDDATLGGVQTHLSEFENFFGLRPLWPRKTLARILEITYFESAKFRTCLWPCVNRWASGQEAGQPPGARYDDHTVKSARPSDRLSSEHLIGSR